MEPLKTAVGYPKPRDRVNVPKLVVSVKTGRVAIAPIAAKSAPFVKWDRGLNNMAILLCHNLKSQLRIYPSQPHESEFLEDEQFFLISSKPFGFCCLFLSGQYLCDRPCSCHSQSATRPRLISEILRCQDAQFDNAGFAVGARFPIDTGFGIVAYESIRLALHA